MIRRIKDPAVVRDALALYPFEEIDLNVEEWIKDPRVAVLEEDGDVGMIEEFIPGVYSVHWFYNRKGKAAKDLAIRMLREVFNNYGVKVARGLTPEKHRAAVMMTSLLGFKSHGTVDTKAGPCVLFMMSKEEFKDKHGL